MLQQLNCSDFLHINACFTPVSSSYCNWLLRQQTSVGFVLWFEVDKLRKWKQDHMEQMASDMEDDAMSGSDMDRRLSDLRKEV